MTDGDRASLPGSLVGAVLGRYQLERVLGEGGMGTVYAARHQELGKLAAVKLLHERYDASEQVRLRFLREGQAVSRIRHPNIVDVYDVGTDAGRVYLVMELLEGEDLRALLAREAPLAPQRAADLMIPVIAAVAAAHDLGVVHRDLKPDNVFLSNERSSISPKVLDFGISKVVDPERAASLTGTGTLLGTPYYMSPEQAQTDRSVGPASDQYSLGVILYECVTGRRPVEEPALYRLIQRVIQSDFPPPRQLNPELGAGFEQVILRAMAREPEARFPTTRALGRALLPFASERVRNHHGDELAKDKEPASDEPSAREPKLALGLGTTLGVSVHERENSRPPVPRRKWGLRALIAAGLVSLVGLLLWKVAAPGGAPAAPATGAIESAAAGESAAPLAEPAPATEPAPRATEASATETSPTPSTSPAATDSALPAASAAVPSKPPAASRPRRAPPRPELAPR